MATPVVEGSEAVEGAVLVATEAEGLPPSAPPAPEATAPVVPAATVPAPVVPPVVVPPVAVPPQPPPVPAAKKSVWWTVAKVVLALGAIYLAFWLGQKVSQKALAKPEPKEQTATDAGVTPSPMPPKDKGSTPVIPGTGDLPPPPDADVNPLQAAAEAKVTELERKVRELEAEKARSLAPPPITVPSVVVPPVAVPPPPAPVVPGSLELNLFKFAAPPPAPVVPVTSTSGVTVGSPTAPVQANNAPVNVTVNPPVVNVTVPVTVTNTTTSTTTVKGARSYKFAADPTQAPVAVYIPPPPPPPAPVIYVPAPAPVEYYPQTKYVDPGDSYYPTPREVWGAGMLGGEIFSQMMRRGGDRERGGYSGGHSSARPSDSRRPSDSSRPPSGCRNRPPPRPHCPPPPCRSSGGRSSSRH